MSKCKRDGEHNRKRSGDDSRSNNILLSQGPGGHLSCGEWAEQQNQAADEGRRANQEYRGRDRFIVHEQRTRARISDAKMTNGAR